jgi:hypothetical protein
MFSRESVKIVEAPPPANCHMSCRSGAASSAASHPTPPIHTSTAGHHAPRATASAPSTLAFTLPFTPHIHTSHPHFHSHLPHTSTAGHHAPRALRCRAPRLHPHSHSHFHPHFHPHFNRRAPRASAPSTLASTLTFTLTGVNFTPPIHTSVHTSTAGHHARPRVNPHSHSHLHSHSHPHFHSHRRAPRASRSTASGQSATSAWRARLRRCVFATAPHNFGLPIVRM